jgi:4,5-dihydroxyphthalate decarboxylase
MTKLALSIATGDYDRVRALVSGAVRIDGTDPIFLLHGPEEIFFRAFRNKEFDVCELSLSSYCSHIARGDCPYIGVPVFPSRMFRHGAIYIRTDRGIAQPSDLIGRRVGIPEWQLTALVWVRAFLADEYKVLPADLQWIQAGIEEAGRIEKARVDLPAGVIIQPAPAGSTLSGMLEAGEIDAIISPRAPSCYERRAAGIGQLFGDTVGEATRYYQKTRIFPIMHVLGVRRELAQQHPWLPVALFKAFNSAKDMATRQLAEVAACTVTLPFVEERLNEARRLMGADYWSYGLESNRHVIDTFLRHHHNQGLSQRLLKAEELFHAATIQTHRI